MIARFFRDSYSVTGCLNPSASANFTAHHTSVVLPYICPLTKLPIRPKASKNAPGITISSTIVRNRRPRKRQKNQLPTTAPSSTPCDAIPPRQ